MREPGAWLWGVAGLRTSSLLRLESDVLFVVLFGFLFGGFEGFGFTACTLLIMVRGKRTCREGAMQLGQAGEAGCEIDITAGADEGLYLLCLVHPSSKSLDILRGLGNEVWIG
jgi:hypothetical protein